MARVLKRPAHCAAGPERWRHIAAPMALDPTRGREILARYEHLGGEPLLATLILDEFPGRIALVSSFGTEAAVLLHMIASIDRTLPVLFIDTGKLFGETLRYRDALAVHLRLTNVKTLGPADPRLSESDPDGRLWHRSADACCQLRKVEPLAKALAGFDAWISGRKRYQGGLRACLPEIEFIDGRVKVNPLASWSAAEIATAFA